MRPDIDSTMIKKASSIVPTPGFREREQQHHRVRAGEHGGGDPEGGGGRLRVGAHPGVRPWDHVSLPETCRRERGSTKIERRVGVTTVVGVVSSFLEFKRVLLAFH
jgi:hypothetical protein